MMFSHFKQHGDDEPIKTKFEYPYSYDPILQYGPLELKKFDGSAYSDRMSSWNFEKFDATLQKVFGSRSQYFDDKSPANIEKFLQQYFDKPNLKLLRVVEYCNVSNGYPCWLFQWNENGK